MAKKEGPEFKEAFGKSGGGDFGKGKNGGKRMKGGHKSKKSSRHHK
jgi:hypothetical protein